MRFSFRGEKCLWILGFGVPSKPNPSSGPLKLGSPEPLEGSSTLNVDFVGYDRRCIHFDVGGFSTDSLLFYSGLWPAMPSGPPTSGFEKDFSMGWVVARRPPILIAKYLLPVLHKIGELIAVTGRFLMAETPPKKHRP